MIDAFMLFRCFRSGSKTGKCGNSCMLTISGGEGLQLPSHAL